MVHGEKMSGIIVMLLCQTKWRLDHVFLLNMNEWLRRAIHFSVEVAYTNFPLMIKCVEQTHLEQVSFVV